MVAKKEKAQISKTEKQEVSSSKQFIAEFKAFISKGNVIDLAIGVIIGGAFGKIVSSLVEDIIMPPIGVLLGGVNFTELKWVLVRAKVAEGGKDIPAVTVNYGSFLQTTLNFLIIALTVFLVVKAMASLKASLARKEAAEEKQVEEKKAKKVAEELKVLMEIRDLLKKKGS